MKKPPVKAVQSPVMSNTLEYLSAHEALRIIPPAQTTDHGFHTLGCQRFTAYNTLRIFHGTFSADLPGYTETHDVSSALGAVAPLAGARETHHDIGHFPSPPIVIFLRTNLSYHTLWQNKSAGHSTSADYSFTIIHFSTWGAYFELPLYGTQLDRGFGLQRVKQCISQTDFP